MPGFAAQLIRWLQAPVNQDKRPDVFVRESPFAIEAQVFFPHDTGEGALIGSRRSLPLAWSHPDRAAINLAGMASPATLRLSGEREVPIEWNPRSHPEWTLAPWTAAEQALLEMKDANSAKPRVAWTSVRMYVLLPIPLLILLEVYRRRRNDAL
jgi:hypothetical protein